MGYLPQYGTQSHSPAFINTSTDLCGPFEFKLSKVRNAKLTKGFVVFVCLNTKAIHLEPVSNLTSEAFLAAFTRFTSIRGSPSRMLSDNDTNLRGASNES